MLFPPTVAVQAAVGDGLLQVVGLDGGTAFEVGNGAADAEDAVVGTCREAEAVHGGLDDAAALVVELAVLAGEFAGHLCIAVHAGVPSKAGCLYGTGCHHPLANGGTALALLHVIELADRNRRHLDMEVSTSVDYRSQYYLLEK